MNKLPFPSCKENAIVITTYDRDNPEQSFFSLHPGESTEFEIPEFAKHLEAWAVGNLAVQIGPVQKTDSVVVNEFNQMIEDIFNAAKGNLLKDGNTLYWNVWFTPPQTVDREEWKDHAEKWRVSIDTDHRSPEGDGSDPKFFDGTPFKPGTKYFAKEILVDVEESLANSFGKFKKNEIEKIHNFLKKHL